MDAPLTIPDDMHQARRWSGPFFADPAALPVTFTLGGVHDPAGVGGTPHRGIPQAWHPTITRRRIDATLIETVFEGTDPDTGLALRVELTQYLDFPVVEWVAWFTATGAAPTPILSDIQALDATFLGTTPRLTHCNGDFYSADGYTPEQTALPAGSALAYAPNGGRPSDGAFPYYRLAFDDWGLALAIGWPAQWAVSYQGLARGVAVRAGQQRTHLRLMPGERIRTPRITVLAWAGDDSRAVNLWRRWYLAHILPRPDGRPMQPHLACAATDEGEEFTAATEENQIRYIERFRQRGIHPDVWWIDAGWYPCYGDDGRRHWPITGTWKPDPERFPRGLQPISDVAARDGAGLLVWFEPERVRPGTELDLEHPDFLLDAQGTTNRLLNLGNPAARQWLTDRVSGLIADNGIAIYRQDFNFEPLPHWRQNEAEDRQGINENLHVQGYLQYWDDLLARHPGLWIDSCSSGGRRNDLETMRRAVPLHYTDYGYGDHPIKLSFHHTLFQWIPYFKEATLSWDVEGGSRFDHRVDSYSFHCAMAPMLFATLDIRQDDYDFALAATMIDVWRQAAELILCGDYYPHTAFHKRADRWVAWQFDRPEEGRGLVQAIRLPQAPDDTLTIHPAGIGPGATYTFDNPETGETRQIPGRVLIDEGFTFALAPRAGVLWLYWRA